MSLLIVKIDNSFLEGNRGLHVFFVYGMRICAIGTMFMSYNLITEISYMRFYYDCPSNRKSELKKNDFYYTLQR